MQGDMGPGSSSSAAGPGSASPSAKFESPLLQVVQYLESCHKGSWHTTLNNHASTRPKTYGGRLVQSVRECKTFTPPGSARNAWRCVLDLPNSFEPGDGLRLVTEVEAATKEAADEEACRLAFSRLLMERPGQVVLRPAHWKVSLDELMAKISLPGGPHQALPVHVNARRAQLAREAASERYTDTQAVWESRVADLLRQILRRHGGSFRPSQISHKLMGLAPGEETTYSKLNKLLQKGELKPFVEAHSEFVCRHVEGRMLITWADGAAPSSASARVADAERDGTSQEIDDSSPASASAWHGPEPDDIFFDCFDEDGFE